MTRAFDEMLATRQTTRSETMALTEQRANRILEKLGFPLIRKANHFEQAVDAYGAKGIWVVDRGSQQALRAYPTLNSVVAAVLDDGFALFDCEKLTAKELDELRAIPSQVARYL